MALMSFFLKNQKEKRMRFRRNERRLSIETYSIDYAESAIGEKCNDDKVLLKLEFEPTEQNKAKVEEIASILWSKLKTELFETYEQAYQFLERLIRSYFPDEYNALQNK